MRVTDVLFQGEVEGGLLRACRLHGGPGEAAERFSGSPGAPCSRGAVANRAFCEAVSKWAFQERGVLRASGLSHRVVAGAEPGAVRPERYRVNDEVEFSVTIHECGDGSCMPYRWGVPLACLLACLRPRLPANRPLPHPPHLVDCHHAAVPPCAPAPL